MHQHWYVNPKGNSQLYNNQISVPPLYSQPQIPNFGGIYGLGISEGWRGRVYPAGWNGPGGLKCFDRIEQSSPASPMGLTAQEPSSDWTTPDDHKEGFTPHGHNGNTMPPINHDDWKSLEQLANWPQLPKHPDFAPKGQPTPWAQPIYHAETFAQGQPLGVALLSDHTGFNPHKQPTPWVQPINATGMFAQGHPASLALLAGHAGFNSHKQPLPWELPVNHAGMFTQGHPAALLPPSVNPFGVSASGHQMNWGSFGNSTGWKGQVNPTGWSGMGVPMGWWNNGGIGQPPGILGGLLKVGKGTMNGIGIISSLIGVGKFLF